jgi:hypothetical protein
VAVYSDLVGHGIRCEGKDYEIVGMTGGDAYEEGGDTVFDTFDLSPYTFLEVSRGGVYGNRIIGTHDAEGVFKLRDEMVVANNQELRQSAATLHIRPNEPFLVAPPARREHYRLTLQATDYSEFGEGS